MFRLNAPCNIRGPSFCRTLSMVLSAGQAYARKRASWVVFSIHFQVQSRVLCRWVSLASDEYDAYVDRGMPCTITILYADPLYVLRQTLNQKFYPTKERSLYRDGG